MKAVGETHAHFDRLIRPFMTAARARRIREIRCVQEQSYRILAGILHLEWGADACWTPTTNQIAGVVLCELAAAMLEEDAGAFPWWVSH